LGDYYMIVDFRASSSYTFMDALGPYFSNAWLERTKSADPVFAPPVFKVYELSSNTPRPAP